MDRDNAFAWHFESREKCGHRTRTDSSQEPLGLDLIPTAYGGRFFTLPVPQAVPRTFAPQVAVEPTVRSKVWRDAGRMDKADMYSPPRW